MKPKTALILAGGLGTRLKSTVPDRQKVAAEVAGRPFVSYLIRQIADAGIRRIILCAGHKADDTVTTNVYTHFSEDFQLKEAQKVLY